MKFATLDDGTPDGRIVVVARDLSRAAPAPGVAGTLQAALDGWEAAEPRLRALTAAVEDGSAPGLAAFDAGAARAPLPRAWQWLDGSVFKAHSDLSMRAYGAADTWSDVPLMYQGLSHRFLGAREPVAFPTEDDGIDFEGEFGVITDAVPMGVSAAQARSHIRLLVQINDWSLRRLGREEMARGFGWIRGKPACSLAPLALTPDELGSAWRDARIALPLEVRLNGEVFGRADGREMAFGFDELVAHAAYSRDLCAGTLVGSGTVANADYRAVGSSCILERRGIEILDHGEPRTPFLRHGDRVRMAALDAQGAAPSASWISQ